MNQHITNISKNIETLQEIADIVFGNFVSAGKYIFERVFINDKLNYEPLYITIYDIHRDCCSCKLAFENKERFFEITYSTDDEGTEERYKDMCNQLISNIIDFMVMENK